MVREVGIGEVEGIRLTFWEGQLVRVPEKARRFCGMSNIKLGWNGWCRALMFFLRLCLGEVFIFTHQPSADCHILIT